MANILFSVSPRVQRCVYIHRPSKLLGCCGCPEYGTIFHIPRDVVQKQHFQCRFPCADATEKSQCSVQYVYQGCKLMIRDRLSFEMISTLLLKQTSMSLIAMKGRPPPKS